MLFGWEHMFEFGRDPCIKDIYISYHSVLSLINYKYDTYKTKPRPYQYKVEVKLENKFLKRYLTISLLLFWT